MISVRKVYKIINIALNIFLITGLQEFGSLVQQLGKLATEPGLDNQNYACKGCGHPVGMNFGKARSDKSNSVFIHHV